MYYSIVYIMWWCLEGNFHCFGNTNKVVINILHVPGVVCLFQRKCLRERLLLVYTSLRIDLTQLFKMSVSLRMPTPIMWVLVFIFYQFLVSSDLSLLPVCRYVKLTQLVLMSITWFSVWLIIFKFLRKPFVSLFKWSICSCHS